MKARSFGDEPTPRLAAKRAPGERRCRKAPIVRRNDEKPAPALRDDASPTL
jgi:hypothetical protein